MLTSQRVHLWTALLCGLVLVIVACSALAARSSNVAVIPASLGGRAPATYVTQIAAAELNDSTFVVVWQDQADNEFRLWSARCAIDGGGHARWLQDAPDAVTTPRCRSFALVKQANSVKLLYECKGQIFLRQGLENGPDVAVTPDSDHVRVFAALATSGHVTIVALAAVSPDFRPAHDAVVCFDLLDDHLFRGELARLHFSAGWPTTPPCLLADGDSLRLLLGLDHASLQAGVSSALARGTSFVSFARRAVGRSEWTLPRLLIRPLSSSGLNSRQVGSLALVPGAPDAWLLSNGGTHVLRATDAGIEELALTGPEASGDAYGHPRVAAVSVSDSVACLAWIDAERQMRGGDAQRAQGEDPTLEGGDIRLTEFNTQSWRLGPVRDVQLPSGATAECLTLIRLPRATVVLWAGPNPVGGRSREGDQAQGVFARNVRRGER